MLFLAFHPFAGGRAGGLNYCTKTMMLMMFFLAATFLSGHAINMLTVSGSKECCVRIDLDARAVTPDNATDDMIVLAIPGSEAEGCLAAPYLLGPCYLDTPSHPCSTTRCNLATTSW
jgi:hypothetical protein